MNHFTNIGKETTAKQLSFKATKDSTYQQRAQYVSERK